MELYKKVIGITTNNKKDNKEKIKSKKNIENILKSNKKKLKIQVEEDKKKNPKEKIFYVEKEHEDMENLKQKYNEELLTKQKLSYNQAVEDTEYKILTDQIYKQIEKIENKIKEDEIKLLNNENKNKNITQGQITKNKKKILILKEQLNEYKNIKLTIDKNKKK